MIAASAVAVCLLGIVPAHGAALPAISFSTSIAVPGSTGNAIEVFLTNLSASTITVNSFNFEVTTTDPDVTFTDADFSNTLAPYIFLGNSFDFINGFTLYTSLSPLNASDISNDGLGTAIPVNGVVGLGRILFSVAPNAAQGGFAIHLTPSPGTSIADTSFVEIPASLVDGEITIASAPEPATLGLLFGGVALIFARRRIRR
jgi:hypothetical protein